jgi:hypothetical protein
MTLQQEMMLLDKNRRDSLNTAKPHDCLKRMSMETSMVNVTKYCFSKSTRLVYHFE